MCIRTELISPNTVAILSTPAPAKPLLRKLEKWGFKPVRISPNKGLQIPDRIKLLISVPGAMSHDASRAARVWNTASTKRFWVVCSKSSDLEPALLKLKAIAYPPEEAPKKAVDPDSPDIFESVWAWATHMLKKSPDLDLEHFQRLSDRYGVTSEKVRQLAEALFPGEDPASIAKGIAENMVLIKWWLAENGIESVTISKNGAVRFSNKPSQSDTASK